MAILVISYSRADQPLVRAVVTLLKTASRDVERAVFWDADLEPGDQWWHELQRHIDEAPQLFVFWCDHSSRSTQVEREFTYALHRGKRVVPVLLDDTPLSSQLAPINGIDLRQAVAHVAGSVRTMAPMAIPRNSRRVLSPNYRRRFTAAALAALGAIAVALWVLFVSSKPITVSYPPAASRDTADRVPGPTGTGTSSASQDTADRVPSPTGTGTSSPSPPILKVQPKAGPSGTSPLPPEPPDLESVPSTTATTGPPRRARWVDRVFPLKVEPADLLYPGVVFLILTVVWLRRRLAGAHLGSGIGAEGFDLTKLR